VVSQRYRRVSRLKPPVRGSPLPLIQRDLNPVEESGDLPVGKPPAASQTQVKILIDTGIRDFKQNIEMEIRATATHFKLGWDGLPSVYLKMPWN